MKIFKQIESLKAFLKDVRLHGKSIGLVPTMGALHQGHVALIRACQAQNEVTVCSVFVNPVQFNNAADLQKYPRIIEHDTQLLKEVQCDVLFCPDDDEMYPVPSTLKLEFDPLDKVLEGAFRPGHFSGVGIVVAKLFHIVQPDQAYFGQKDWQQFAIIRQLVEQMNFGLTLHSVATLRETNGLALSSRNLRLTAKQRVDAGIFYKALLMAKSKLNSGEKPEDVQVLVKDMIEKIPDIKLEYFEVADSKNLTIVKNVETSNRPIMLIAGYVGDVRLIDNMFLKG